MCALCVCHALPASRVARVLAVADLVSRYDLFMPWLLRIAIASLLVVVIGVVMITWAFMSTGWETLSWFAWGTVTAGAGLIGSALLSFISAVAHRRWRRFSLALLSASVLLFLLLLVFARFA